MTDPISDMLTQIRNAQAVLKSEILISFSGIKHEIAKILEKQKLIEKVEKKGKGVNKKLRIILKYIDQKPAISNLKKISKPGQRIYLPAKKIRNVRSGLGIAIISTSKGLITNKQARKKNLGGEIICEIW
ncbi:MAG: 30S ribosomal protein S8 [Candidatus Pacebacteria bacterium]|nr:30S ribosomal protein S8 [Candidatus Paceibacterota bacterium]